MMRAIMAALLLVVALTACDLLTESPDTGPSGKFPVGRWQCFEAHSFTDRLRKPDSNVRRTYTNWVTACQSYGEYGGSATVTPGGSFRPLGSWNGMELWPNRDGHDITGSGQNWRRWEIFSPTARDRKLVLVQTTWVLRCRVAPYGQPTHDNG